MPDKKKSEAKTRLEGALVDMNKPPALSYSGSMTGLIKSLPYTDRIYGAIPITTFQVMRGHPTVSLALRLLKKALLTSSIIIKSEDKDVERFLTEQWIKDKKIFKRYMDGALMCLDYGHQVLEIEFGLRKFEGYDQPFLFAEGFRDPAPGTCTIQYDQFQRPTGVKQGTVEVPIEKLVIVTHRKEHGNLAGISHLWEAYGPWRNQEIIMTSASHYFQRAGSPTLRITYPRSPVTDGDKVTGDANLDAAVEMAENVRETGTIIMPYDANDAGSENQWSADWLADEQRGDMFKDFIDKLDRDIMLATLIPPRIIDITGDVGTYNMIEGFQQIFLMLLKDILDELTLHISEYINKKLLLYNFGEEAKAEISFSPTDPRVLGVLFELIKFIANTGKLNRKFQADIQSKTAELFGLPELTPEEILQDEERKREEAASQFAGGVQSNAPVQGQSQLSPHPEPGETQKQLEMSIDSREVALGVSLEWKQKIGERIRKSNEALRRDMKPIIHLVKNEAIKILADIYRQPEDNRFMALENMRNSLYVQSYKNQLLTGAYDSPLRGALSKHYARLFEIGTEDAKKQMGGKIESGMSNNSKTMLISLPNNKTGELLFALNNMLYYFFVVRLESDRETVLQELKSHIDIFFDNNLKKIDGMETFHRAQQDVVDFMMGGKIG